MTKDTVFHVVRHQDTRTNNICLDFVSWYSVWIVQVNQTVCVPYFAMATDIHSLELFWMALASSSCFISSVSADRDTANTQHLPFHLKTFIKAQLQAPPNKGPP
jgi:hypothetical protein